MPPPPRTTGGAAGKAASTDVWPRVQEELRRRLTAQQFRTWFQSLRAEPWRPGSATFTLLAPNEFFREWIGNNYLEAVREAVHAVIAAKPDVRLRVDASLAPRNNEPERNDAGAALQSSAPLPLNPHYTFEEFVTGPSNRLAHAAAKAVADSPGTVYNPLYLHGAVGLGKSHLLQAICHQLSRGSKPLNLLYLSCESFVNDFISAIQNGSLDAFRARCRHADALVIDDLQFLQRAERSQEEFFHTFNALHNAQRQIVLSSDSEPRDIAIEQRLISRFASGLVARIDPPCLETRQAILRRKADLRGSNLPDDVVTYIAEQFVDNIRELEGALVRIIGYASFSQREIDLGLAKEALAGPRGARRPVTIPSILAVVAEHFHVRIADLQSKKRTRSIVHPRQVCMYLARSLTPHSLEEIGGYFGGRDHSTVLHAEGKIRKMAESDQQMRETITRLQSALTRKL